MYNQNILIKAITINKAKDSYVTRNIVTTHDEIYMLKYMRKILGYIALILK